MLVSFLAPVSTVAVFVVVVKAMVAPVPVIEPTVDVLAMAVPDLSLAMVVLVVVVVVVMGSSWHTAMLTPAVVLAIVVVVMAGSAVISSIMEPLDALFCFDGVD